MCLIQDILEGEKLFPSPSSQSDTTATADLSSSAAVGPEITVPEGSDVISSPAPVTKDEVDPAASSDSNSKSPKEEPALPLLLDYLDASDDMAMVTDEIDADAPG